MRIVFMGTPDFAVPALENLVTKYSVVAVYTQPDKASGRGRNIEESPVKKAALTHNIPVFQPPNLKSPGTKAQLIEMKPDAIVIAAFGQILPQSILDIPPFGCINIHPSLLPKYRGVAPVPAAILNGDEVTGVSIMLLDKGVDTGPVLTQMSLSLSPEDNAGTLMEKLSLTGAQLLIDTLPGWFAQKIQPQPQNDAGASYTRMMKKEAGEIDWKLPAVQIWRQVRAYQPWPGAYSRWQGKQIKILEAIPLALHGVAESCTVIALKDSPAPFGVVAGDGVLGIIKLQMEGKKPVTAKDFLNGQRQIIGAVLG